MSYEEIRNMNIMEMNAKFDFKKMNHKTNYQKVTLPPQKNNQGKKRRKSSLEKCSGKKPKTRSQTKLQEATETAKMTSDSPISPPPLHDISNKNVQQDELLPSDSVCIFPFSLTN